MLDLCFYRLDLKCTNNVLSGDIYVLHVVQAMHVFLMMKLHARLSRIFKSPLTFIPGFFIFLQIKP